MNYSVLAKTRGRYVIVPSDKVEEYCNTHDDVFELGSVNIYIDYDMLIYDMSFIPYELHSNGKLPALPYVLKFIQENYPSLEEMAFNAFTLYIEGQQKLLKATTEEIIRVRKENIND